MNANIQFYREVDLVTIKIEITIHEGDGCKVYFTGKDNEDRRVWRTALTDREGNPKIYRSISEAIMDAEKTIDNLTGPDATASPEHKETTPATIN